jgi:hypothetical protein
MKTLEDLEKEYQKKRQEIELRDKILATLPKIGREPSSLHFPTKERPWVSYKVETLTEALEIIKAYGSLQEVSAIDDGCVSTAPPKEHPKQYLEKDPRWEVPECIEFHQEGGKGFYMAKLVCYVVSPKVRLGIEIKSLPYQARISKSCTFNHSGDPVNCTLNEPPTTFKTSATARISYGGGSRDAFMVRYYYSGVEHLKEIVNAFEKKED